MKKLMLIVIGLVLILSAVSAMAQTTDTSALSATATVMGSCRLTSVTNLDFGTYDPTNTVNDDDGVGDFTFRCTRGTNYDLYISGARTMTDGTDTLNYDLYQDLGRTTVWASASPGTTGTSANNAPNTTDIYGRIPALQDVQAGAYSGTVTVTVEY